MEHIYDVIIIGGGPGGYTAALYCSRAGLDTVVLEKLYAGGQMALTPQIDNYPGFDDGVDGFTLAEKMKAGAERFGTKTILTEVLSVALTDSIKAVRSDDGTYYARSIIIAAGASPRNLDLPGEKELTGRGVSYCAACDGMLYRGKTVVIIGGGNTAAADALLLSRICQKVILIHRRDTLRATQIYHEQLKNTENLTICWNSIVTELLHEETVTGIKIKNLLTDTESTIPCNGIFVSIGRKPETEFLNNQLNLDTAGYIIADESTCTSIPGVFAVGDIRTKAVRQIVTAASDGATAAHFVAEYLQEQAD